MKNHAEIGIFGGSGFYSLLEDKHEVKVETPYGSPSDVLALGEIAGHGVAFLPRHGKSHSLPPHMINYRANLWAMKELGVTRIIGPCAAGSLQAAVKPGHFVVSDQLIDRTNARKDTFYDGPITTHVSFAYPGRHPRRACMRSSKHGRAHQAIPGFPRPLDFWLGILLAIVWSVVFRVVFGH